MEWSSFRDRIQIQQDSYSLFLSMYENNTNLKMQLFLLTLERLEWLFGHVKQENQSDWVSSLWEFWCWGLKCNTASCVLEC